MSRRKRTFIGTSVVIGFVPLYALMAMALAQAHPLREASVFLQVPCYAALGLAWILPLMPLISWMQKPSSGSMG